MSLSVHTAKLILAFFLPFASELLYWFAVKNEIQNQALEVQQKTLHCCVTFINRENGCAKGEGTDA